MSREPHVDAFSLRALRFHVPLVIGVAVCVFCGWFELTRAREGHTIAWVYAFEWPGFAIVGTWIWWRVVTNVENPRPGGPPAVPLEEDEAADDPGLAAWQQYLADIQRPERVDDVEAAD